MVSVGEAGIAAILEYSTGIFYDVGLLVYMAIGLPLGFYIARKVISLVRAR